MIGSPAIFLNPDFYDRIAAENADEQENEGLSYRNCQGVQNYWHYRKAEDYAEIK